MPDQTNYYDKLHKLKEDFLASLPAKIKGIQDSWNFIKSSPDWNLLFPDFKRLLHTVAGSAPYFGFAAVAETARKAESLVRDILEEKSLYPGLKPLLDSCLTALFELQSPPEEIQGKADAPLLPTVLPVSSPSSNRRVFIGDAEEQASSRLANEINCFDFKTQLFPRLPLLQEALEHESPGALILDVNFPEGDLAGPEFITHLRRQGKIQMPVLFTSRRNDFLTRLEAVKAGGEAFLLKPIRISEIIDKLEQLTTGYLPDPYRVLIIDDDPQICELHASILEERGMKTQIINDPFHLFDHLGDFHPDLILLDLNMPGCDGFQLARLIRQITAYVSIPIVFLSNETNLDRQLAAMGLGGDDFLTKPIQPHHLISSISIRAERMRLLRSFMQRDGLTNLYNHSTQENFLEQVIQRNRRLNIPFVLAIIDIDEFKVVNDTYGHAVGDAVLVVISRLLQQRLRKTDIIGRIGGEEFSIILQDTTLPQAEKIMNQIRVGFSKIRHDSENGEFSVTFSGGMAAFPQWRNSITLAKAADKALYLAKSTGRNQILVSQS
jgi:diguanylate cyclase (GGDEF)-like protein